MDERKHDGAGWKEKLETELASGRSTRSPFLLLGESPWSSGLPPA